MTNSTVAPKPTPSPQTSVMLRMAERFGMSAPAFESTLMATIIPGGQATKEQVAAFLIVADQYALNPFTKEIYAFPAKGGGIVPIVSIDGWLKLMNSHPGFDGLEFEDIFTEDGKFAAVTAHIHRKDRSHPISTTEYLGECLRSTEPWRQWPRRMLRHKATIQCARYAFGFAGVYDEDEAERIIQAQSTRVVDVGERPRTLGGLTARLESSTAPASEETVNRDTGEIANDSTHTEAIAN
jgi:phage recombination protein Bet